MGRHKMKSGICRLCGMKTMLSFEHVPPKTTFNSSTKYSSVAFEDFIKVENPIADPPKGKIKQGGIGYNSFCERCNNFLGAEYVPAYKKWVIGGFEILLDKEYHLHYYTIKQVEPLKILKQIISMFLAINDEWYLDAYSELSTFVSDKESKILPDKFKVFSYLTRAEEIRYMHHVVKGNFKTGIPINCSEIAYPPYGYVLTIDSEQEIDKLNNITSFKNFDKPMDLNFKMFQLSTYMPFPLDYRTKSEIEIGIESNIKFRNKTSS
ncbi:hypothetical protein JM79_2155 [Gramella sp. Hel_I_59]|uniref:hypothetical protein n=1 Tax=Gramella sp. Hel_I_59 TaxID=1249978 RepID=UPI001153BCAF|nr:hypothetical protein [Gramella sp. Hel_I_59]TQI71228.1 hypothetical protein JM79_2155 [Gramella sp. Hel_I_59]